ncbi:MAG: hypothetical protein DI534_03005 [Leifsonia xyli]|nr:MAG: hypothetical protein DI534_03005 [Leifsonia xyli]
MRRTTRLLTPTLLAALLLAGCTTPAPMPSAPPSSDATPVFASDEEALAAAQEAYGKYIAAADAVVGESGAGSDRVKPFLSVPLFERDVASFAQFGENEWRGTGKTTFEMKLQRRDSKAIVAYVCDDFSGTDVIDKNGQSVVPPDRQTRIPYEVEFDVKDNLRIVRKDLWDGSGVC